MLKLFFLSIIIFVIIQLLLEEDKPQNEETKPEQINEIKAINIVKNDNQAIVNNDVQVSINNPSLAQSINRETFTDKIEGEMMEYQNPKPWSKIVYNPKDQYPYYFHIKLRIPSLNDYQAWKQVVPNIDFNPKSGELIIPSKDEPSALALANLIAINFTGQMSLSDILDKELIQISINKAKNYELVQTKLREQIVENLYGKTFNKPNNSFERDLARQEKSEQIDFTSETFSDTFEHFTTKSKKSKSNDIEAYDGTDYTYL
jgi:hypothetical protein